MKAVFTDNPYAYWKYGKGGELHLFSDDELAKQFLVELVNDPLYKGTPMLCDTPNDVCVCESWANLLCNYADCAGYDCIVLHPDDEGLRKGFIEWTLCTALPYDTAINWTWPNETLLHVDKLYANIWLDCEERADDDGPSLWLNTPVHDRERNLCHLLHDLFDIEPFEVYDFWDGNKNTGEIMTTDEIAA